MSDRVSGLSSSRPNIGAAPKVGPNAPSATGGAAIDTDALDAAGAAAALQGTLGRVFEIPPVPPTGGSPLGRFFQGVGDWFCDFGVGVADVASDAWDGLTDLWRGLGDVVDGDYPLGIYERLMLDCRTQYPRALANEWRGRPANGSALDTWVDAAEMRAMGDAAMEELACPSAGARREDSPRVHKAREVARQLRAALHAEAPWLLADPAQRDELVRRATAIARRFAPQAGQETPVTRVMIDLSRDAGVEDAYSQMRVAVDSASEQALVARAIAVARLAPEIRARFEALRVRFDGSPMVQESLDALAASGGLHAVDGLGGDTTLDHLERIATGPLDPAIAARRDDFLGETLMELAEPASVCQRGRNTCGGATAQGWLAEVAPAEYVRLAYGLASPAGMVATRGGDRLTRDPHWNLPEKPGQGDLRTTTSRLLQAAFMDVASNGDYDNRVDRGRWHAFADWIVAKVPATQGAWPHGVARLMESLSGREYDWLLGHERPHAEGVFGQASRQRPIPVLLNYTTEGEAEALHWVRLVGYDQRTDMFTVRNAQRGTEDRIAGPAFRERLIAVAREEAAR